MAKEGHNVFAPADPRSPGPLEDDFLPNDALPICPKCLKPCHPLQYYCDNCASNAAINPLTPYIAFVNIRFNYDIFCTMWRKMLCDKSTSIVVRIFYLAMIIIFVPIMPVVVLPALLIARIPQPQIRTATTILLIAIVAVILAFLA